MAKKRKKKAKKKISKKVKKVKKVKKETKKLVKKRTKPRKRVRKVIKKTAKKKAKKTIKKPKKIEGKPIVIHKKKEIKKKKNFLAVTSFVLSLISAIVLVSYIIALIMTLYTNGSLVLFTYLAALVIFVIAMLGVGLSSADLSLYPDSGLSKKALYLNLIILVITFALILIKIL